MILKFEIVEVRLRRTNKVLISLFTMLFIIATNTKAQDKTNCNMLNQIFKNDTTKIELMLNNHQKTPIIFVDVKHFFDSCKMHPYKGRKVLIVHDSSFLKEKNVGNIIIYDFLKKNDQYYIVVGNNSKNSYGGIEFTNTKKGWRISKVSIGYY